MAVVTIAREFGSEGNYVGVQVAEALGYRFISKKEIYAVLVQYGIISIDRAASNARLL